MSPVTLAGFVLPVLFLVSHSVNASSVGLAGNGVGENLVSSHLGLSATGSTRAGATRTLASYTSAGNASSVQFSSSIENVAGQTRMSSTYVNGKALGNALVFLGGRSVISPRCLVPASDPPPSVAPESSTALLFGLGLAALSCVGFRQRRMLNHRN